MITAQSTVLSLAHEAGEARHRLRRSARAGGAGCAGGRASRRVCRRRPLRWRSCGRSSAFPQPRLHRRHVLCIAVSLLLWTGRLLPARCGRRSAPAILVLLPASRGLLSLCPILSLRLAARDAERAAPGPLLIMATKPETTTNDIKVDPNALFLEEVFTDRRVGTIRRMTPVKKDGNRDTARAVLYVGETQVLTPAGALPIGFEIGAGSLEEAAEKFGQLAREAIERTVKELQELRRQAASSIVVPQGGLPPGGFGGGGIGGGGKIQMP